MRNGAGGVPLQLGKLPSPAKALLVNVNEDVLSN